MAFSGAKHTQEILRDSDTEMVESSSRAEGQEQQQHEQEEEEEVARGRRGNLLDSGNHSSEEELEEINMGKEYTDRTATTEKRKWSELSHSEASSESDTEFTRSGNVQPSAGVQSRSASTSAASSCDTPSGDEDHNHNKVLPVPLEFSTSPPTHVYKPRRSVHLSQNKPSISGGEAGGSSATSAFRQQEVQAPISSAPAGTGVLRAAPGLQEEQRTAPGLLREQEEEGTQYTRLSTSLDDLRYLPVSCLAVNCPARYLSPRKKTRRVQLMPRPCLDFEKMQQLRARSVTGWRHGGELSLFCW